MSLRRWSFTTDICNDSEAKRDIVQTETTVTRTYLYITVAHKAAEENNLLWSQVLYGISGGDGEIVSVALSQVGNVGGQPYWSWYGFDGRVESL